MCSLWSKSSDKSKTGLWNKFGITLLLHLVANVCRWVIYTPMEIECREPYAYCDVNVLTNCWQGVIILVMVWMVAQCYSGIQHGLISLWNYLPLWKGSTTIMALLPKFLTSVVRGSWWFFVRMCDNCISFVIIFSEFLKSKT